jgi:hypothetical protein
MSDFNTAEFGITIEKFIDAVLVQQVDITKRAVVEVYSRLTQRTPIDTGRAKDNWIPSIDTPHLESRYRDNYNPTPLGVSADPSEILALLTAIVMGKDFTVYITNNLTYINPLEFGHSQRQAPEGMLRKTAMEFDEIVNTAILST